MNQLKLDARKWRFLDNPHQHHENSGGDLMLAPLIRQFGTAKEILARLQKPPAPRQRGVLLADDVGLGKTTVGALVAWAFAMQGRSVRIYAPNDVLQRRWAEELERHMPMLGVKEGQIRQGHVERLRDGHIQVTTHHALVKSHKRNKQKTACDLMIIDEAHRAKGDGSAFNEALRKLGDRAKRKLILTATPFSIRIAELKQLLQFIGAEKECLTSVEQYAQQLEQLYSLDSSHDAEIQADDLVKAATSAINRLKHYVIRHGIDDLLESERKHFGEVGSAWGIETRAASDDELKLLLRVDRLMKLTPGEHGAPRNDPRFHIGWQQVSVTLKEIESRVSATDRANTIAHRHLGEARNSLGLRRHDPHPKMQAVGNAIRRVVDKGEKVLIFCHHLSTASELLTALEKSLKTDTALPSKATDRIWRQAWAPLRKEPLSTERRKPVDPRLIGVIIDWLCSPGVRRQILGWLGETSIRDAPQLRRLLKTTKSRKGGSKVPSIYDAAIKLAKDVLAHQSKSTRAVLRNISRGQSSFGHAASHFPGKLDDGLRVMGAWRPHGSGEHPTTLYTGKPDLVISLFNSPFGPDVLVATDRLSEGIDLHRYCRHLVHYELDPSPVRTLQRNGRIRRVDSWSALTGRSIEYAYPAFRGTRDEKAVDIMQRRIQAFGLLLGGVPSIEDNPDGTTEDFADQVVRRAHERLEKLNGRLGLNGRRKKRSATPRANNAR